MRRNRIQSVAVITEEQVGHSVYVASKKLILKPEHVGARAYLTDRGWYLAIDGENQDELPR